MPYSKSRLQHLRLCYQHCRQHKAVAVVAVLFAAYTLTAELVPLIDFPPVVRQAVLQLTIPKIPLHWAAVIVLCVCLWIVIEGSFRLQGSREAFLNPKWETIKTQTFTNEAVDVDGKQFVDCRFHNAKLVFHGKAPTEFLGNTVFGGTMELATDDLATKHYLTIETKLTSLPGVGHARSAIDSQGNVVPQALSLSARPIESNDNPEGRSPARPDDPLIYFSLSNKDPHQLYSAGLTISKDTIITFENGGKTEALDVQLTFANMQTGSVAVPIIPRVKVGDEVGTRGEVRGPNGEDVATFVMRDIELLFAAEWQECHDLTKATVDISCQITYRNPQEQKFLAEAFVRYSAYTKQMEVHDFHFWRV